MGTFTVWEKNGDTIKSVPYKRTWKTKILWKTSYDLENGADKKDVSNKTVSTGHAGRVKYSTALIHADSLARCPHGAALHLPGGRHG